VVDLWDTVFFMSVKAYTALMSKLESFLNDNYLRTISNLSLSYFPSTYFSEERGGGGERKIKGVRVREGEKKERDC
jgi:hypothetical protein